MRSKEAWTETDATHCQLKIIASAPGPLSSNFFVLNGRQDSSGEKVVGEVASQGDQPFPSLL